MASNNQHNNQPRRKRNKKPVKRYSEEYNNRPNPYTGYSSDGNYHPGAKKRSMEEEPAAAPPRAAGHATSYDYSRAGMTDAVWPPATAGRTPSAAKPVAAPPNRLPESNPSAAYASPAPSAAKGGEERPFRADKPFPEDMARLAETAAKLEGEKRVEDTPSQGVPPRRNGSHRRRNHNRQASEQARRAKMEAKKAVVDQMAQDVAAQSASENLTDDVAAAAEAAERLHTDRSASVPTVKPQPVKTEPVSVGVNWDEFYDAAFPPKEQTAAEVKTDAVQDKKKNGEKPKNKEKKPIPFEEVSAQDAPMTVKPVLLDEGEALPYDEIIEENRQEAEEAQANAAVAEEVPSEETPAQEADNGTYHNRPLAPDDLIPVLDFAVPEKAAAPEDAREAEELQPTEPAAEKPAGFVFGEEGGNWHELVPPAEAEEPTLSEPVQVEVISPDDSISLLSQRLLESYLEIENGVPEEDDEASEPLPEEAVATVDLNQFFTPAQTEETVEVEVEAATEPTENGNDSDGIADDTDEEAISEEIESTEDETALLAEVLRVENAEVTETAEDTAEESPVEESPKMAEAAEGDAQDEEIDIFSVVPPASVEQVLPTDVVTVVPEETPVKPYRPKEKPRTTEGEREKDENVYESVLIVDDSRSVVDNKAADKQDDMQFLHSAAAENPTAVFKLPEGPIVLPTDIDDADFQEQWLDEDEDGDGMAKRTKRARRRISAFIGGVAILFAIMVVVSVLSTVITGFNNIGSTNEKKTEYSTFIAPVVLNDPMPFETVEKADNQVLLASAIWRVLENMSADEFTYDATQKIVVPAAKVAQAGRDLFGPDIELNMKVLSESDGSAIYYYDSIDDSLHVSTMGIVGPTPVITKMTLRSDYAKLVVGYVLQDDIVALTSDEEVECYKYMEYVLAYNSDGTYYVQSVRDYVEE